MISKLVAYETGQLDNTQIVALFQHLLDTGMIYVLQGRYQRTAQGFLEQGLITKSPAKKVRRRAAKRGPKALAAKGFIEEEMVKATARVGAIVAAQVAAKATAHNKTYVDAIEAVFGLHGQG